MIVKRGKRMKYIYTILLLILASTVFGLAEDTIVDSRGRDFYFHFLPNYHNLNSWDFPDRYDSLYVFISSPTEANGYISYRGEFSWYNEVAFHIPQGGGVFKLAEHWFDFELDGYLDYNSISKGMNGSKARSYFHVTSDTNVSVYALSRSSKTSDGTMIFPTDALGMDYLIATYNANEDEIVQGRTSFGTPSQFSVIAVEDSTVVNFNLSCPAYNEKDQSFSRLLYKGDSYLVQSLPTYDNSNYDLTSSRVSSNKPIAVFGGHQRALIPYTGYNIVESRDHLFAQMAPVNTFGKTYIITPLPSPAKDHSYFKDKYRIFAPYDNTKIYKNGQVLTVLNENEYYEGDIIDAFVLTSNKEMSVFIYKKSGLVIAELSYDGDPFMLMVPPKKQFLDEYITYNLQVNTYAGEATPEDIYTQQYLVIITLTPYRSSITIDDEHIPNYRFIEIEGSCYSYAFIRVTDGEHKLKGDHDFGVYVCGYGYADSYGYVGGMKFNTEEEISPSISDDIVICPGDTATIEAFNCAEVTWSPGPGIEFYKEFVQHVSPTETTVYHATMIDSIGCEISADIRVEVHEVDIDAGDDLSICENDSIQLNADGGVTYIWDNDTTLSCTDCKTPFAKPIEPTMYYVSAIDENGCTGIDSVFVTPLPYPTVEIIDDFTDCAGDTNMLWVAGGSTYLWDSQATLSCLNCDTTFAAPLETTTYYVTVFNEANCKTLDSITITINPKPLADAGDDIELCRGRSIQLEATGGISYKWEDDPSLSCTDCANPVASPTDTRDYYLMVTNEFGCIDFDTITITVYDSPDVDAGEDIFICDYEPAVQLIARGTSGCAYEWDYDPSLSCTDCDTTIASPTVTTTYYITIDDNSHCTSRDSVTITVYPNSWVDLGIDTTICDGEIFPLVPQGTGVDFKWENDPSLSCTDCENPDALPTEKTTYYLTITDENGCVAEDSITIGIYPMPVFETSKDTSLCVGNIATVNVSGGGNSYLWYPSDLVECDTCLFTETKEITRDRVLYVAGTNEFGCTLIDSINIFSIGCALGVEDLEFEDEIYCFEEEGISIIRNLGDSYVRIDSMIVIGRDKDNFRFVIGIEDTMPFELEPLEKYPITITFIPDDKVNYEAKIIVYSELLKNDTINLLATKSRAKAKLSIGTLQSGTKPGENTVYSINLNSSAYEYSRVQATMVRLKIEFNIENYYAEEEDFTLADSTSGWSLVANQTLENNGKCFWDIEIRAENGINSNADLLHFNPTTMLKGGNEYYIEVTGIFENRTHCSDILGDDNTVFIDYCLDTLRAVIINEGEHSIETNGTIISDELTVTVNSPYEAQYARLSLFDLNGREVIIHEGYIKKGSSDFTITKDKIHPQFYFLRYQCGDVLMNKKILIMK